MLLTIKDSGPAHADLSWLLHKRPDRIQSVPDLAFGKAKIFFTASDAASTECALLLRVDPVWLRQSELDAKRETGWLSPKVYASGVLLGGALDAAFSTALAGRCLSRPDSVDLERPLQVTAGPVPIGLDGEIVRNMLAPLGWTVEVVAEALDSAHPGRGDPLVGQIRATACMTLRHALQHFSVVLPVLDGRRLRFVDQTDIDRLIRIGADWLDGHPARDIIVRRYLGGVRKVWSRYPAVAEPEGAVPFVDQLGSKPPLNAQGSRIKAAIDILKAEGVRKVADLGCGEGDLCVALLGVDQVASVMAVDPSPMALGKLERVLADRFQQDRASRIKVLQGAATYPMPALWDCDAAVLLEVIEHLEPWGLQALEQSIWGSGWRPRVTVITTPNRDFNAVFGMAEGKKRHADHRFEWGREEFEAWYGAVAERHGLVAKGFGVGTAMEGYGSVTQGVVLKPR